jgi:hypothetical protein
MTLFFWQKPRGVGIRLSTGRIVRCSVSRDRSADVPGLRAWKAVPAEPLYPADFPGYVVVRRIPRGTRINYTMEAVNDLTTVADIRESPPEENPGGSVSYLPNTRKEAWDSPEDSAYDDGPYLA